MKRLDNVRAGTLAGTCCTLWINLNLGDVLQTIVLAIIGSTVSYLTNRLWTIIRKQNRKTNENFLLFYQEYPCNKIGL